MYGISDTNFAAAELRDGILLAKRYLIGETVLVLTLTWLGLLIPIPAGGVRVPLP